MTLDHQSVVAFAAFGVAMQAALLAFFASRRWWPGLAVGLGVVVYGFGGLGLPLGAWLLLDSQPWRLVAGPILTAGWALYGADIDLWRPRPWRGPPVQWRMLAPYLVAYFFAQMFMWWPLWDIDRVLWALFLILFVPSTLLNIGGHSARTG
jgi:hypothetical protein